MWYEWVFDGIGTELISLLVGVIIGGFGGYKIAIKKNGVQNQKGKNNMQQNQELEIDISNGQTNSYKTRHTLQQFQKAGNNAQQSQIGRIKHGNDETSTKGRK